MEVDGDTRVESVVGTGRDFKVFHQLLCVSGIDFENQIFQGFTELALIPLNPEAEVVRLSCRQADVMRVTVNEVLDAEFTWEDPMGTAFLEEESRDLSGFIARERECLRQVDANAGRGELVITIPRSAMPAVKAQKMFGVSVEFAVQNPQSGIRFAGPPTDEAESEDQRPTGQHLFTVKQEPGCGRGWFPCVDAWNEPCTWKLEVTVDAGHCAVVSGELLDTVFTPDMRRKTFHYHLAVPSVPSNIGLAVGAFDIVVQPDMPEVTHFALPGLKRLLKYSTATFDKAYEFLEELLAVRFPYPSYKQVFVDQAESDTSSFASLNILSVNLLYHKGLADPVPISRTIMAHGVAQQFFGTFISPLSWSDSWLTRGLASYVTGLFLQRCFGNSEYLFQINKLNSEVTQYEEAWGPIQLQATDSDPVADKDTDPSQSQIRQTTPPGHAGQFTASPLFLSQLGKKAHVVIRLVEKKLGKDMFCQVLNQIVSVAANASQQKFAPAQWMQTLLGLTAFQRCVSSVTGQDLSEFANQWIHAAGHARFHTTFAFNRKRNIIELEINQDSNRKGVLAYTGPFVVGVQELDGYFSHTLQIDGVSSRHEVSCHSKARRQKKRKIPLWTTEEVDMDLSQMDQDSPVLWLRLDPELRTLRSVVLQQPDYHWQYQLRYEKDVIAQLQALDRMPEFPSAQTRFALLDTIQNDQIFYRVRITACYALAKVANKLAGTWSGPPAMLPMFNKLFASEAAPTIVKPNDFGDLQNYFLQCNIPMAMGQLRSVSGSCAPQVQRFLLDLLKYNDNVSNKMSDDYYRAALVTALGSSLGGSENGSLSRPGGQLSYEGLFDVRQVASEIVLQMNHDHLVPSYKRVVLVSCLKALGRLSVAGALPSTPSFFLSYTEPTHFWDVRCAAIQCLVQICKHFQDMDLLLIILDKIANEDNASFRYLIAMSLIQNPPFVASDVKSHLNTEAVAETMWSLLAIKNSVDGRLRNLLADLYFLMYGSGIPSCFRSESMSQKPDRPSSSGSGTNMNTMVNRSSPEVLLLGDSGPASTTAKGSSPGVATRLSPQLSPLVEPVSNSGARTAPTSDVAPPTASSAIIATSSSGSGLVNAGGVPRASTPFGIKAKKKEPVRSSALLSCSSSSDDDDDSPAKTKQL